MLYKQKYSVCQHSVMVYCLLSYQRCLLYCNQQENKLICSYISLNGSERLSLHFNFKNIFRVVTKSVCQLTLHNEFHYISNVPHAVQCSATGRFKYSFVILLQCFLMFQIKYIVHLNTNK